MTNDKTILLCSGGLNSAVLAAMTRREHPIALLHVRFGHRADQREFDMFKRQAENFSIKDRLVVEMPHFAEIGGSARVCHKKPMEDAVAARAEDSNCYVPGLIGGLVHAAFNWAWTIGAGRILLGLSEDLGPPGPKTCTIYPDYSREYVQLLNHQLMIASPSRSISVEAPLADLTRMEIIKLGRRLEVPFDLTWSCLSSSTRACGGCIGCVTRHRGFLDAAIPDPIHLGNVGQVAIPV